MSVLLGSDYLLAVVSGVLYTYQVSVRPTIQISVFATNAAVPSISWLALTAVHRLRVDAQIDAVCISMAVMATILARVTRFANLKEIPRNEKHGNSEPSKLCENFVSVLSQTCFLAVACSTPLPKG